LKNKKPKKPRFLKWVWTALFVTFVVAQEAEIDSRDCTIKELLIQEFIICLRYGVNYYVQKYNITPSF